MFKLPKAEEIEKENQRRKTAQMIFDKYVAKLGDIEKAAAASKKKVPYYLQKEWLKERAAELLGLWMAKRVFGAQEPQLVIYPHEAAIVLKKSLRSAQRVLKEIRALHQIPPRIPIPMKEFCDYTKLNEERIKKLLLE